MISTYTYQTFAELECAPKYNFKIKQLITIHENEAYRVFTGREKTNSLSRVINIIIALVGTIFTGFIALIFERWRNYCSRSLFGPKELNAYIRWNTLPEDCVEQDIQNNGLLLKHASDAIKNNRAIVIAAVKQNKDAIHFASQELQRDPEIIRIAAETLQINTAQPSSDVAEKQINHSQIYLQTNQREEAPIKTSLSATHPNMDQPSQDISLETISSNNTVKSAAKTTIPAPELIPISKEFSLDDLLKDGLALKSASDLQRRDKAIVLTAVKQNGLALNYAHEDLKKDKVIVQAAAEQNIESLQFAHNDLKNNKDFIFALIKINPKAFAYVSEANRNCPAVVLETIKIVGPEIFSYCSNQLLGNRDLVQKILKDNPNLLPHIPENFVTDAEFVSKTVSFYPSDNFKFLPTNLQGNKEYVSKLIFYNTYNSHIYASLPPGLQLDEEIAVAVASLRGIDFFTQNSPLEGDLRMLDLENQIKESVKTITNITTRSESYNDLSTELRKSKLIALISLIRNKDALWFFSDELKDDKDIALEVVKKEGPFNLLSQRLKNDPPFILEALKYDAKIFEFVSEELKDNRDFILQAVKVNGKILSYLSENFKSDIAIVLEAVKQSGSSLKHAKINQSENAEILRAALNNDGLSLAAVEIALRTKELVLIAVQQNSLALKYAPEPLRNDEAVVLQAVMTSPHEDKSFSYASDDLRQDKKFVLQIVKINGLCLQHTLGDLFDDLDVVETAIAQNREAINSASKRLQDILMTDEEKKDRDMDDEFDN